MSNNRFGSLPNWWFRSESDPLLSRLKSNTPGTGIAAMKCLLAISVLIDFYSRSAEISLTAFEEITGLSRPMVVKGLSVLESNGVIEVDRGLHTNRYELTVQRSDAKWAKVPLGTIRKNLKSISNRGIAPFIALKLYITMLSFRMNNKQTVKIAHITLRDHTGVQPAQVRSGLDVLYSHSLIHLMPREDRDINEYVILGIQ